AFFVGAGTCFAPRFLWETVAWYRSFLTHDTEPLISASLARRMLETVALAVGVALTLWSVLG
ncbi:MAG: hypothetical protein IKU10_02430, partial [Clostridia bacterium]|nr:hypothetical protein [Clostridia bacterium]